MSVDHREVILMSLNNKDVISMQGLADEERSF